ncbi:MAG TPA: lipoyl(octanoyl) transferase LipB [Anaerohalosphaeraceae bacterium]|nr:lipoyl(octanoyl) transferase LipB [Anaerohalosphaeraceae bacterium]HOL88924.1 lipoyl(octanoyl) transferase LipB [Anaerohalosphaeraceae bacterium]HPP56150.1 lipoyl(octanoyl) transferase LipB [Anaerohalosphaeraceae bacterium]
MQDGLIIQDLGLTRYADCLAYQEELCAQRQADVIADTVLLTEHEPVITLGVRMADNKILAMPEDLHRQGIEVCRVGRGGAATAHNPGQIVMYPILKLSRLKMGLSDYVHTLGQIGIEVLRHFDIGADWRKQTPGLWVNGRKIGSVGVQVRKGVTLHGIAVNICNDLSIFDAIVPCGLEGVQITSVLKELGRAPSMQDIKSCLTELCMHYLTRSEGLSDE